MKNFVAALSSVAVLGCVAAAAQEPITAARELYASAAYEDALDVLSKMRTAGAEIAATDADVLRAFCLIALKREAEARSVIESVVTERPTYVPGEDDASPRIRAEFREIRRRLLPDVARQLYLSAREDYEQRRVASAAAKFGDLLRVLADPDIAADQTFADLRMLAEGFRVVSTAAADVATSADTQSSRSPSSRNDPADRAPASALPDRGSLAEADSTRSVISVAVIPPVAISQKLPPWGGAGSFTGGEFTGAIDFIIDEEGKVESVTLRKSVHPLYDRRLLEAAKSWTYQPARRGDQPVKFQKTLVVRLNSR